MPNQQKFDITWLKMCLTFGYELSKDPSRQVGACVVSPDNRLVAFGYNGFPAGVEETSEKWERPLKYQYVRHAESNAIINAPFDTEGCTLFSVLRPCHICLGEAINAGIKRVVFIDQPVEFKNNSETIWTEFILKMQHKSYPANLFDLKEHDGYIEKSEIKKELNTHEFKMLDEATPFSEEQMNLLKMFPQGRKYEVVDFNERVEKEAKEREAAALKGIEEINSKAAELFEFEIKIRNSEQFKDMPNIIAEAEQISIENQKQVKQPEQPDEELGKFNVRGW